MKMANTESSSPAGEVLFTISNNQMSFSNPPANKQTSFTENEDANVPDDPEAESSDKPDNILCIMRKNCKTGAAYYNMTNQQLYVYREMVDLHPEFPVTRALYREVNPFHTVSSGTICDPFVKCLMGLANNEDEDTNTTLASFNTVTLPPNLSLMHIKEVAFETCEYKIYNIRLPSEPENATSAQKEVFLHSLIDFDSKLSVHALGALIKFTEKNWAHFNPDGSELRFMHINQNSLLDRVFIDRNTFDGLHVFRTRSHDARFKHGRESSNREGYSIFKLLSQGCKSKMGLACLRNVLNNPTKSLSELKKRLDFIEFVMAPTNQGFIEGLQDNLKKLTDVSAILGRIQYARASNHEWETIYTTIYHTLFLNELCGPYRQHFSILQELDSKITNELYNLQYSINSALDFTQKIKRSRPVIKFGLDSELDAKELRKQDIAKHVTAAAKFAVNQLPEYLNECSVVYLPEMGHLVSIPKWDPDCDPTQLQEDGFQFIFEINGSLHYKNAMCAELDINLGNIYQEIIAHETRIINRLSNFVLRYNKDIREPLKTIALIDCLISMAYVAKEKGYVRPKFNQDSTHEIKDGKHPLLDLICSDYVPNDYYSGGRCTHMKIITGPNASGKSVYLKQVALIVFMAHVGSFVPAKSANIGLVHSIHSRIHATESAGVSLSAFMLDLSQMSQALHNSKSSSLVVLDEFGRGTTGDDGTALLVGALQKFLNQEVFCPNVLVSTHLQQVCHFLPRSKLVSHVKLDHTRCDNGDIAFLYKVVEGVSNSFAFEVSDLTGLDQDIVQRARELHQALYHGADLPLASNPTLSEADLVNVRIPPPDIAED